MKKLLKILYVVIYIWIIGGLLILLGDLYKVISDDLDVKSLVIQICSICILGYLVLYLYKFLNAISRSISTETIFSNENGRAFSALGRAFIYYSIFRFVITLMSLSMEGSSYALGYNLGRQIGVQLPLLILALFLLIISKLIKDGYMMKTENELTI